MESKATVVCVIVGLLGAIAALLSFVAEVKRTTASDVLLGDNGGCVFPRNTALGVGTGAALALLISQIIISFETGCFTSKYAKLPIDWSVARRNSFISRAAFGIGFVLLITALSITTSAYCIVVKPGIFAAAGIFSLVSVAFGVLFYRTLSTAIQAANTNTAPQAVHLPPQAVYPSPQAATGFIYDVEQPQFPTNKPC